MLSKVGQYRFAVEPFHCDFEHKLFLGHLGNHLLNAAEFHSDERGYGMSYLNTMHRTWVLSRLVVEMQQMPKAYDHIDVQTWVDSVMRYFTSRNFQVVAGDGRTLGYGRSVWAMIDTQSRQPVDIMSVRDGLIADYVETEKPCPVAGPSRVKMGAGAQHAGSMKACYSDVDINGHVNSVKYIDHILDLWDMEWHRSHDVARFDIAYVAEAHSGDTLDFWTETVGPDEYCVRVTKPSENGTNDVEVCRSKIKFMKK